MLMIIFMFLRDMFICFVWIFNRYFKKEVWQIINELFFGLNKNEIYKYIK